MSDYDPQGKKKDRDALLALALLSMPESGDEAQRLWEEHSGRAYRGILQSRGWTWNDSTQSYKSDSGSTLDSGDLKKLSLLFILAVETQELEPLAMSMASGQITIDDWEQQSAQILRELYLALAALAVGGLAVLTPENIADVTGSFEGGTGLNFALDRLDAFAADIENEAPRADSVEAITARSGLYGQQANNLFETAKRSSHATAVDADGRLLFLFERNILDDDVRHCAECPALTDLGWVAIGTLPVPGTRICMVKCHCTLDYSLVGDGEHL